MRRDELIAIHDCPVHTGRIRALVHALVQHLPRAVTRCRSPTCTCAGAQATLVVKAHRVDHEMPRRALLEAAAEPAWRACGCICIPRQGASCSRAAAGGICGARRSPAIRTACCMVRPHSCRPFPRLHRAVAAGGPRSTSRPAPALSVLDLYCGLGSTLREWTSAGSPSLGVELSGEAVKFAALNAPDARCCAAPVRSACRRSAPWWSERARRRVAYVNPPRSGLEDEVTARSRRSFDPHALPTCPAAPARWPGTWIVRGGRLFAGSDPPLRLFSAHPPRRGPRAARTPSVGAQRPGSPSGDGRAPSPACRPLLHIVSRALRTPVSLPS